MIPWLSAVFALMVGSGPDVIESVDLFGLRTVSEATVRTVLRLAPGDSVPGALGPIRARLLEIPGVAEVNVTAVCCGAKGGALLYVGIRETGTDPLVFRDVPAGDDRLPAEVIALGDEFRAALMDAVQRGATGEDASHGHALSVDPGGD